MTRISSWRHSISEPRVACLKDDVQSELLWFLGRTAPHDLDTVREGLREALDFPDEWWRMRFDHNLRQWHAELRREVVA